MVLQVPVQLVVLHLRSLAFVHLLLELDCLLHECLAQSQWSRLQVFLFRTQLPGGHFQETDDISIKHPGCHFQKLAGLLTGWLLPCQTKVSQV